MAKKNILKIVSGVYRITNIANKLIYIGSSRDIYARFRRHKRALRLGIHHSNRMQIDSAIYGVGIFSLEMLEPVSKPGADLYLVEQKWLDQLKPYDPKIGYNICPSTDGSTGLTRSEETRKKMSESALKRPPEHYEMVAASLAGKPFTVERCLAISDARRNSEAAHVAMAKLNAAKRALSDDDVRRIRSMETKGATAIAREFGVSRRVIRAILSGETYTEVR